MGDGVSFQINLKEFNERFRGFERKIHAALLAKCNELAIKLQAKVEGKLSGEVLNVRSGALRSSIFHTVTDGSDTISVKVASSGDVKYAGIHEFGGFIPPHDIVPDKAKALAFIVGGKQVFAKIVHHPGSHMPERSFLRSSKEEMADEISDGMKEAVLTALRP